MGYGEKCEGESCGVCQGRCPCHGGTCETCRGGEKGGMGMGGPWMGMMGSMGGEGKMGGCDCPSCKKLMLAKWAKMKVMMKKMEAAIEKEHGATLDKVAKLVVDHYMKKKEIKYGKMEEMEEENESFHQQMEQAWKT